MTKEGPWWCKPGVRHRLEACKVQPMRLDLPAGKTVKVNYAELQDHAGYEEVAGVLCVSASFTDVQAGGNSMPHWTKLYTRVPQVVPVWPRDSLTFRAVKGGSVILWTMQPLPAKATVGRGERRRAPPHEQGRGEAGEASSIPGQGESPAAATCPAFLS